MLLYISRTKLPITLIYAYYILNSSTYVTIYYYIIALIIYGENPFYFN